MSVEIKAGIFDVGGVLHSNEMPHVKVDIIKTLQLNEEVFTLAWNDISPKLGNGEITEKEFWELFIDRVGSSQPLPEESFFVREYKNRMRVNNEVINIARELKSEGLQIALLSNTIETHVRFLSELGLFENFGIKIFSNEVGISKPDPKIYLLTLERLGTKPEQSVFIDDSNTNVVMAIKLGILGILFENPDQLRRDLNRLEILK